MCTSRTRVGALGRPREKKHTKNVLSNKKALFLRQGLRKIFMFGNLGSTFHPVVTQKYMFPSKTGHKKCSDKFR